MPKGIYQRKPWCKTAIKAVVSCRECDWTWKPQSGFSRGKCPKCGKLREVRNRNYEGKKNIASLKKWRKHRPGYATEWTRRYRRRAVLLVGRGVVACVRCGCDVPVLLEINHKNGCGGQEHREMGQRFYTSIAKMTRTIDDLELLCKPCNAVHALEMKHGPLPFKVVWNAD